MPTKREKKFRKTFEKTEGFSFVTPVTGLSRPNTGKEDDDENSPYAQGGRRHIGGTLHVFGCFQISFE
jgi:hypothetical protein